VVFGDGETEAGVIAGAGSTVCNKFEEFMGEIVDLLLVPVTSGCLICRLGESPADFGIASSSSESLNSNMS